MVRWANLGVHNASLKVEGHFDSTTRQGPPTDKQSPVAMIYEKDLI